MLGTVICVFGHPKSIATNSLTLNSHSDRFTPLTAFIRVFIFYLHIKYHILNMLKVKCDINQQDLKRDHLHFVTFD